MSIGRHVGPAFAEFVGDLDHWSQLFWDTYNSLKHAPNYEYNPSEVPLLGDTGELLLLGALLNRVAGNKIPMKVLCQSHRTHMMAYNMRKLLGPDDFQPNSGTTLFGSSAGCSGASGSGSVLSAPPSSSGT